MYFDVTREELLTLLEKYEQEHSLRSLATKASVSYSSLIDFKRKKSEMLGDKNLRAVMRILRPASVTDLPMIPVVGYVGAGSRIFPYDDFPKGDGLEMVPCPTNVDPATGVGVEVKGLSMWPDIDDGDRLYYDERVRGVPVEWVGKKCIVWIVEGPTLVKRVLAGSKPGYYRLVCTNSKDPDREELIEWSAKIKNIEQR